ncbi:MAG: NAD-dependent epimerase/dehydratase family protein [Gemmatimonadetes bacterium]|nr:NAD-dependent epimerase/dehydratase family protein [Gemmatimonadota bacterium]
MTPRKVLVTGGAGFIGSHVAEAYRARGEHVWVLDDLSSGRRENVSPGIELVVLDVGSGDVGALFREAGGFDVVNHHAAQIDVRTSVADPRLDARVNLDGLLNLLECARGYGTQRFVFVSSGGVIYGEPAARPTPETAPKLPLSPYGVSKLASEHYLHYYQRVHGLEYVALRYANVYGPRQDPNGEAGVVSIFSSRLMAGEPLTIFGDGEQTRDFVYVGDVVTANLLATDLALPPATDLEARAFNVATGRETSVNGLARALMAVAGREVATLHAPERPGELRHSCLDVRRLRGRGWRAATSLGDGLARTYEFICAQGAVR